MFFGWGGPLIWHPKVRLTNPGVFWWEERFDLACQSVVHKSWCFFWVGDPLIWHPKVWLTNPGVFKVRGSLIWHPKVWFGIPKCGKLKNTKTKTRKTQQIQQIAQKHKQNRKTSIKHRYSHFKYWIFKFWNSGFEF